MRSSARFSNEGDMTKGDVSLLSCIGPLREDPALVILSPPLGGCWGAVPMPRGARKQSESSIYHVMVRGVNQMQLFYDDEDRIVFVERIRRYRDECGFKLYAWCLMDNHVHLLIEVGNVELATIMKKLLLSYSHWFNNKYDRSGYLYEGRFVSKAVEDDHYLLGAVRYIHRNPLEVGGSVDTWTSYRDYMGSDGPGITDTGLVLGMLAEDPERARLAFHELVTGEVRLRLWKTAWADSGGAGRQPHQGDRRCRELHGRLRVGFRAQERRHCRDAVEGAEHPTHIPSDRSQPRRRGASRLHVGYQEDVKGGRFSIDTRDVTKVKRPPDTSRPDAPDTPRLPRRASPPLSCARQRSS